MRIGAYNVLGLTGYPKEESSVSIGEPGDQRNGEHFAAVFSGLGCDVLALLEGVAVRTMQAIAGLMRRAPRCEMDAKSDTQSARHARASLVS